MMMLIEDDDGFYLLQYLLETMINLLHLNKVANSIVGNENIRGLSGGEKRRVSDDEDDSDYAD